MIWFLLLIILGIIGLIAGIRVGWAIFKLVICVLMILLGIGLWVACGAVVGVGLLSCVGW